MFNENDYKLLNKKQISIEKAKWQIDQFIKGVIPIKIFKPATINDGIEAIDDNQLYIDIFDKLSLKITKFVPASGAASRMFKGLFEFSESISQNQNPDINDYPEIAGFFRHIEKFAFYEELATALKAEGGIESLINENKHKTIIDKLLYSNGLAYGELPKGLLKFHYYSEGFSRTPFEEHLVEGAHYARSANNIINLHFTISPEHEKVFFKLKELCVNKLSEKFNCTYNIDFSIQKPSTDTMAVTADNKPFYDIDGNIFFRPGGHGALIENLNEIDSDLIFVKNIDNVVPENKIETTVQYKKVLAGYLYKTQQEIFSLIRKLKNTPDKKTIEEAINFLSNKLQLQGHWTNQALSEKEQIEIIIERLNRPIRACGMVKNIGEPGGGPFLIKNENGDISPQIIESSQVDEGNQEQLKLFNEATHFNPVDLVLAVHNFEGKKFDLMNFIDSNTCFISKKSKNGRELKALELPGLWNGAMANWNTIFIEVPSETFNPVKTVNDLLRTPHQ